MFLVGLTGCELDITNPNAASEDQVLGTTEGIAALAVGMQQYYATNTLETLILTPGVTSREVAINTTFANLIELEDGGAELPTTNGNILQLWSRNYRVISMAEQLIANVQEVPLAEGTQSGLLALAHLYKGMALGNLAMHFEQAPTTADRAKPVPFVPRQEVFEEAVAEFEAALDLIDATAPSPTFTNEILAPGFDLRQSIQLFLARYNLFAENYDAALAAAEAVDPAATSVFPYDDQSQNPIYDLMQVQEDYAPRDLFGTLTTDTSDARLDFYMSEVDGLSDPNELPINDIRGFFASASQSIPVYLPDEAVLIRAEALVRQGMLEEAVEAIDAVRTQPPDDDPFGVGGSLPPYDGPLTADALLDEICQQRRAELFMQGLGLEDRRRLTRPGPEVGNPYLRTRNFYPYPQQERLNNPNTPDDPAI